MKIPDPIIDPATSIVASVRVIALTNPESDCGVASVETAELLMQRRKKREGVGGGYRRRFHGNPAKCRSVPDGPLGRMTDARSVASERDGLELVADLRLHAQRRAVGARAGPKLHRTQHLCDALVVIAVTRGREIEAEYAARGVDVEFGGEALSADLG